MTLLQMHEKIHKETQMDSNQTITQLSVPCVKSRPRKMVKCNDCSLRFKPLGIHSHLNKHHKDQIKDNWFFCSECQYYYPTNSALKKHIRKMHSKPVLVPNDMTSSIRQTAGNFLSFALYCLLIIF